MSLEWSGSIICTGISIVFETPFYVHVHITRHFFLFLMRMTFELFLLVSCVTLVFATRLTPLENNDKLQDVKSRYVAEWQWESWPVKQDLNEQELKAPGPRLNPALWRSTTGTTWYFFGGYSVGDESKTMNSDVWKYSVVTRVWENLLPSLHEATDEKTTKNGGKPVGGTNFFGKDQLGYESRILCGGVAEINSTMDEKLKLLYQYTRRKKLEEEKREILKSVAVYTTRGGKSNTVWQIDLKDKVWTTYVCCCDIIGEKRDGPSNMTKPVKVFDKTKKETLSILNHSVSEKHESSANRTEEEDMENYHQHLPTSSLKNKKKKINQSKKSSDSSNKKMKEMQKRNDHLKEGGNINNTKDSSSEHSPPSAVVGNETTKSTANQTDSKLTNKSKKEASHVSTKEAIQMSKSEKMSKLRTESDICPEFEEHESTVAWCDGGDELLITADVSMPQIILWAFDLRTSHWSRQEVKIPDDVKWLGCSKRSIVRYAGIEDEVYMFCTPSQEEDAGPRQHPNNSTGPSVRNPSENYTIKQTVYRINYRRLAVECLGEIHLGSNFNSSEGQEIWRNYSKSILKVVRTPENDTILILAHSDLVDLWILSKDDKGKYYFDAIEKIWRGSALKWFNRYYATLYNLQFASETGNTETILMTNPRSISDDEYWPRERGRFIIRIFKNENLKSENPKNESFENRTREQNLTYELLQSDLKAATTENQMAHNYSLKVLVFFGISLGIFAIFGFVAFIKRCVNCPPTIRIRNECHKSPVIIRYSIIPDNLLQPVA